MKYSLKMYGEHLISSLAVFFLLTPLVLVLQDNAVYEWIVSFVIIAVYWSICGFSFIKIGKNDAKNGENNLKKVIISSLVFIIPSVLLTAFSVITSDDLFRLLFRYWNVAYMNLSVVTDDPVWLRIIISLSHIPGFAAFYLVGRSKYKKETLAVNSIPEEKEDDV